MSVSKDVGNLFQRFGGNASEYQEVSRDDDAKHAALRWPLLHALDIGHPEHVPGTDRIAASVAPTRPAGTSVSGSSEARFAGDLADERAPASGPALPPLFGRGHRHASMPPPVSLESQAASRFSPPPVPAEPAAPAPAQAAQPAAAAVEIKQSFARGSIAGEPVPPAPRAERVEPAGSAEPVGPGTGVERAHAAERIERVAPAARAERANPAERLESVDPAGRFERVDPAARFERVDPAVRTERVDPVVHPERAKPAAPARPSILGGLFADKTPEAPPSQPTRDLRGLFDRLARTPLGSSGASLSRPGSGGGKR